MIQWEGHVHSRLYCNLFTLASSFPPPNLPQLSFSVSWQPSLFPPKFPTALNLIPPSSTYWEQLPKIVLHHAVLPNMLVSTITHPPSMIPVFCLHSMGFPRSFLLGMSVNLVWGRSPCIFTQETTPPTGSPVFWHKVFFPFSFLWRPSGFTSPNLRYTPHTTPLIDFPPKFVLPRWYFLSPLTCCSFLASSPSDFFLTCEVAKGNTTVHCYDVLHWVCHQLPHPCYLEARCVFMFSPPIWALLPGFKSNARQLLYNLGTQPLIVSFFFSITD